MYSIFVPVFLSVIWGVGVPKQHTGVDDFPLANEVASLNWFHDGCHLGNFWPMIYSPNDMVRYPLPANCAERPLLIGNELEIRGTTPSESAAMLYAYRDHAGPLYCCGSLSNDAGWEHTLAVLDAYQVEYGTVPPLTGLHIHVYAPQGLERWRVLADTHGWQIVVSEYACIGSDPVTIAACLPAMTQHVESLLQPVAMFWFSWHYTGYPFAAASLVDSDGAYTVVGEAWLELSMMDAEPKNMVFLPILNASALSARSK